MIGHKIRFKGVDYPFYPFLSGALYRSPGYFMYKVKQVYYQLTNPNDSGKKAWETRKVNPILHEYSLIVLHSPLPFQNMFLIVVTRLSAHRADLNQPVP